MVSITELSVLVLVGLAAATYAKSEGANQTLAAVIGVASSVLVYLLAR